MGSIRARGRNTWELVVSNGNTKLYIDKRKPLQEEVAVAMDLQDFVGGIEQTESRRKRIYETFHGSRKEALVRLHEMQVGADRGELSDSSSVADFLGFWWRNHVAPRLRPSTQDTYRWMLRDYVLPNLGDKRLDKLTPPDVQNLLGKMERTLAPKTVQTCHQMLNSAFRMGVDWDYLPKTPMRGVRAPRQPVKEMYIPTRADVAEVLRAAAEGRADKHLAFVTLSQTGLRVGELLGLRWRNVDLVGGVLYVREQSRTRGAAGFAPPKSDRSNRTIPLTVEVQRLLLAHRERQDAMQDDNGQGWNALGLVFPAPRAGEFMNANELRRNLKQLCAAAGVPTFRVHDMRHFAATEMLRSGAAPLYVSRYLGHASLAITTALYIHVTADDLRGAVDRAFGGGKMAANPTEEAAADRVMGDVH